MEPSTYKLLLTALNDYEATVRSKFSLFAHVRTYIHMYFIFLFFLQLERNHSQLPNTGDEVHCLMSQANWISPTPCFSSGINFLWFGRHISLSTIVLFCLWVCGSFLQLNWVVQSSTSTRNYWQCTYIFFETLTVSSGWSCLLSLSLLLWVVSCTIFNYISYYIMYMPEFLSPNALSFVRSTV